MPILSRSRMLCVDDDKEACDMLSALMSSYGIDTTCAHSAGDAWLLIKEKRFDLYLLDGWLPGIDGFEFCRQIRQFDSRTPILFYSGAAYDVDKQKGIAAGANAYVTKPDVEDLIETVVDLIEKSRPFHVVAPFVSKQPPPAESWFSTQFLSVKTA
jgi:two-component system response regulator CssR